MTTTINSIVLITFKANFQKEIIDFSYLALGLLQYGSQRNWKRMLQNRVKNATIGPFFKLQNAESTLLYSHLLFSWNSKRLLIHQNPILFLLPSLHIL